MLNAQGQRELAYVVKIDEIYPIEGADRVELAAVGGWRIMVQKNQFKPGDPAIYFEIDSKVPETEPFKFLEPKHYKIKTQKYFKGTVISQGLLMHAENFGWTIERDAFGTLFIKDDKDKSHFVEDESRFLTAALGVTYAEAEDNARKGATADKYKRMAQRYPHLFSHQPFRWLMKRTWGKKLLFLFFGRKKDKKSSWPTWVTKTDEERIQNVPWILTDKTPWIVTEKIDGTSTTFTIKRKHFGKYDFYVCSRNVVFDKPNKKCFYNTNVYLEMAEKYDIEKKLKTLLDTYTKADWITIQGETYGPGIQNRDYSVHGHCFMAFNLIMSHTGRWNSKEMKDLLEYVYGVPCVPIVDTNYILPDTVEELLEYADGISVLDGKPREGFVFRDQEGKRSFKAVSNNYLLKYHT